MCVASCAPQNDSESSGNINKSSGGEKYLAAKCRINLEAAVIKAACKRLYQSSK